MASQSGHLVKTNILKEFITKGSDGKKFKGDLNLFFHLLLPNSNNRVYNLNSTSLIKLLSKLFKTDQEEMTNHLNQNGDISETIKKFFEESKSSVRPLKSSKLTLKQVDKYLDELTTITKEQEQLDYLRKVSSTCTGNDLQMIVRMIKKDLRINAGEKVLLDAITANAYEAFKVSRDLNDVINRSVALLKNNQSVKPGLKKDLSIKITLMKAVKPMLADACKSCESAFKKCPNGIYAEIKYDGERLQVHKNGNKFEYYSRNLKPVQEHKVSHLKEFIPKAFPNANDLIIDSEVLLYDHKTKKPLPFGKIFNQLGII
jgi:DNA ligase-3